MNKKRIARLNAIEKQDAIQQEIKKFLRMNKNIVYGVRSINAQANILTRPTQDWDAYAKNPKKTSNKLQRELDKIIGGNYFYSKPAQHKGTWKVKTIGDDLKQNTFDDEEIADFSIQEKKNKIITIDGIRYRSLKEEIKAKQKSLSEKEMKFRHAKDQGDLNRIRSNMKIKRLLN